MHLKNKTKKTEIDETKLSQEELDENGINVNKPLLIFCFVLLAIIIVLAVVLTNL